MGFKARSSSSPGKKKKAASAPKAKPAAKARGRKGAVKPVRKAATPRKASRPAPAGKAAAARGSAVATHLKTLRTVLQKSGCPLTHWVDLCDRVGGPELGHGTLVRILAETQKLDRWSANCIVLNYRGLYGFGEHAYLLEHQDQLDRLGEWK